MAMGAFFEPKARRGSMSARPEAWACGGVNETGALGSELEAAGRAPAPGAGSEAASTLAGMLEAAPLMARRCLPPKPENKIVLTATSAIATAARWRPFTGFSFDANARPILAHHGNSGKGERAGLEKVRSRPAAPSLRRRLGCENRSGVCFARFPAARRGFCPPADPNCLSNKALQHASTFLTKIHSTFILSPALNR